MAALVTVGCGGLTDSTQPGDLSSGQITALTVQPASLELAVGAIGQLTPSARTSNGRGLPYYEWTSSNTAVATVSSTGAVRGISVGHASITVSAGGRSAVALVNVK
jgi:alpha-amylase